MSEGFVFFEVFRAANGFETGWYYRLTGSPHNEPVGPFPSLKAAEDTVDNLTLAPSPDRESDAGH